ncbi:MAG: ABC transporter permease [Nitrospira sp.]|nr:ABC transporter permease [Nitrospira sp.]MCP9443384.1 ABC transporter permease [Nitrospira sp.]
MKLLWAYSARNVWMRSGTTMLTIAGLALVSLVLLAVLMLGNGLDRALIESGSPDNLLLLRKGATTEIASGIYRDQAHVVSTLPGIARTTDGRPLAIPELVALISLTKTGADSPANVVVRGTRPDAFRLRPQVRLSQGRTWQPGTTEIVIGAQIATRFLRDSIGTHLRIGKRDWLVVGIMEAQGTAFESEIWGDVDQLMSAYGRDSYSSLTLRLSNTTAFQSIDDAIAADTRLLLQVKRERDYYREKSMTMATFIRLLGFTFTFIFAVGAVLGGTMTMYGAVASRTREIGMLRALGFRPRQILSALLFESLMLGALAGLLAIGGGMALQFVTLSTMNFSTFSELAFRLTLTPGSIFITLGFALSISLLGGIPPAIRAARLPVTAALHTPGR